MHPFTDINLKFYPLLNNINVDSLRSKRLKKSNLKNLVLRAKNNNNLHKMNKFARHKYLMKEHFNLT